MKTAAAAPANLITTQSLSRLAQYMSWGNRANGVLMVATGGLGFFGALFHASPNMFSSALLSIYVCGFGVLLLQYEFARSFETQRDYGFMYSYLGRTAFLLLSANLMWTCDPLGFFAALLTNANAVFSGYVIMMHPAFVEQRVSRVAINGVDGEQDTSAFLTSGDSFDPSSAASRSRGAR